MLEAGVFSYMPSASTSAAPTLPAGLSCLALRRELGESKHLDSLEESLINLERYVIDQNVPLETSPAFTGRDSIPLRFKALFSENAPDQPRLLVPDVLRAAIAMEDSEVINGLVQSRDPQLLLLRNRLLVKYNEVRGPLAAYVSGNTSKIAVKCISEMWQAWVEFEKTWLYEEESHIVASFQPLVDVLLAVEPFLRSRGRERVLPHPRSEKQKVNSVMMLEAICSALPRLTAVLVPAVDRCLIFDPVLLLLAEHVQGRLRGTITPADQDEIRLAHTIAEECCDVAVAPLDRPMSTGSVWSQSGQPAFIAKALCCSPLMSPQDSRLVTSLAGLSQADFTQLRSAGVDLIGCCRKRSALEEYALKAVGHIASRGTQGKRGSLAQSSVGAHRADNLTAGLLRRFDQLLDVLLSMKSTLEHIPTDLSTHPRLPAAVVAFNTAYKRAARLYMEPDNLL
ncbi:hypothetical protein FOZ61_002499 [Perkinsus olseni]|uniref:Uncharacterized protein n=2 Tax=Perkinsus olseni TaxID=32597 RepID=A0A7J6MEB9_PEROL|nr:hypothetical protein FOZ61_002499 [Perkinsus olseni]